MARCFVGSNCPVMTRGARHPYAARTLWARIIGKRSPSAMTIFASTPVSSGGRTMCWGVSTSPLRVASLYQWTRNRFSGCGSSGSTDAKADSISSGTFDGSASCEKVGRTIFASWKRSTVRSYVSLSTSSRSRPSCLMCSPRIDGRRAFSPQAFGIVERRFSPKTEWSRPRYVSHYLYKVSSQALALTYLAHLDSSLHGGEHVAWGKAHGWG